MAQTLTNGELHRLFKRGGFANRVYMGTDDTGVEWYFTGSFDPRPDRPEVINYLKQQIPVELKTRRRTNDAIESIFKHRNQ